MRNPLLSRSVTDLPRLADHAAIAAAVLAGAAIPAVIIVGRAAMGVAWALLALAILVAYGAGRRWPLISPESRAAFKLLLAATLLWLPSLLVSPAPLVSLGTWLRTEALVVTTILFWTFFSSDQCNLKIAHRVFVAGMVLAGGFGAYALLVDPQIISFRAPRPYPELQLKAAASVVACALPVLLYFGWRLGGRWRPLSLLACVLGSVIMLETHSKSSLAGVIIALAVAVAVKLFRRSKRDVILAAAVGTVAVMGGWLAWLLSQPVLAQYGEYAVRLPVWLVDRHRQIIWQFAMERFTEMPWLGWGLNTADLVPGGQDLIPGLGYELIPSHPHNWLVQLALESGLVGVLPTLAVVLWVFATACTRWRQREQIQALAWLSLWSAFWMASMFNFSFWALWWTASAALLSVLVLAARENQA